ncbi:YcaO-like family protein [Virgibacillus kimchii]
MCVLFDAYRYTEDEKLLSFNLTDGKIQKTNADRIFLLDGAIFNDTCGVASHLSSEKVIESAFYEFFERQCLVYRWLTKTPGKKVDIYLINNKQIDHLYNKAFNFVDDLYIIDISLHHSVKVILTIGIGEYVTVK